MSVEQDIAELRGRLEALERGVSIDQLPVADLGRALTNNQPQSNIDQFALQHSVRDNAIGMLPFCYLEKTSNQAIAASTFIALNWEQAIGGSEPAHDPYGMHVAGSNVIQAVRPGWYLAMAQVGWTPVPTGTRLIGRIVKTGAPASETWSSIVYGDNDPVMLLVGWFSLQVGEQLAVHVHQNSAGSEDVLGTNADQNRSKFAVIWQHHNVFEGDRGR